MSTDKAAKYVSVAVLHLIELLNGVEVERLSPELLEQASLGDIIVSYSTRSAKSEGKEKRKGQSRGGSRLKLHVNYKKGGKVIIQKVFRLTQVARRARGCLVVKIQELEGKKWRVDRTTIMVCADWSITKEVGHISPPI